MESDRKTIMIVGAGKAQVPLIEAAKNEDYRIVVCDMNPDAPGVPLADVFCKVSTKDRAGLLRSALEHHIDGIVANSEYAMCDIAYISERLGLIGNTEDSIQVLTSKSRFREVQKRTGLYAPASISVNSPEQTAITGVSFPFVIKPDQSSGSRGMTFVSDSGDAAVVEHGIREAVMVSRNGRAVVEEYVPMPEYSAVEGEIFIHNGQILWDGLFLTIRSREAEMLPMTYVFPLPFPAGQIERIKRSITTVLDAAGVSHGEYNVEMFFTEAGEPFVIEINPRQGGYELPLYVKEHCGIDYYRLLVTTAMGDDGYFESLKCFRRENRFLVHHMLFPRKSGRFSGVRISNELKNKIYRCRIDEEVGTEVKGTTDASSCIGCVDLVFDNPDVQIEAGHNIEKHISVCVE